MDDEPKQRPRRQAYQDATKVISSIVKHGTKRSSASTHVPSGPAKKARTTRTTTPPVNANINPTLRRTPNTKRSATHASLIEQGPIIYASEMETQIVAEARGVTRKNIPLETFRLTYLSDFNAKAGQKLTVESVKKVGEGDWEEEHFYDRLCQSLSKNVRFQTSLSPLLTY